MDPGRGCVPHRGRLPAYASDLLNQVAKSRARLERQLGRRPSVFELAADLELSVERVVDILRHSAMPVSLSEPLSYDSDAELGDVLEDPTAVSPSEAAAAALLPDEVAKMLVNLDDREREIVRLRFGLDRGEPRTLEEVGLRWSGASRMAPAAPCATPVVCRPDPRRNGATPTWYHSAGRQPSLAWPLREIPESAGSERSSHLPP